MTPPEVAVDLSTCDREPIHIPGAIQPHGVLLAFDTTGLRIQSANAASLGPLPALGAPLADGHLNGELRAEIAGLVADPLRAPDLIETELDGHTYDVVIHRADGLVIVELEAVPADAAARRNFAVVTQRALRRIQSATELPTVLEAVAAEVRALTGFDRVMVYRFAPDDSGIVEAEAKRDDLEPFLGLHYPASDIPAQARRLYTLNPLRLIADVSYRPVALVPPLHPATQAPLDLSHSVLRSVSPIHVEYLTNMGVRASLSISIVLGDRLWGLVACHHMSPRRVPHAVRVICQLLAQTVSILIDRTETAQRSVALERSLAVQTALLSRLLTGGEPLPALADGAPNLRDLIACDGAAVLLDTGIGTSGEVPSEAGLGDIRRWLGEHCPSELFVTSEPLVDCPALVTALGASCGMLAMRFSRDFDGYALWFRREERETVRWGGNPEKHYTVGPLGPRLTPRGSFAEWSQTVVGRSQPWTSEERLAATRFRRELQDIGLTRARSRIQALEQANLELDRLSYVVSHDVRAPLRGIASLSTYLDEDLRAGKYDDALEHAAKLHARVVKLDKLTTAILDYSRSGYRKHQPQRVDVAKIVRDTIELLDVPASVTITIGEGLPTLLTHATLLQQVFMNLLSNALKYGLRDGAGSIEVAAVERGAMWEFAVADHGAGVEAAHFERIFELFRRVSRDDSGSGVGLAIVRRIVDSVGGRAWVESRFGEGATFRFSWPKSAVDTETSGS